MSTPPRRGRPVALIVVALCLVAAIFGVVGAALLFGDTEPAGAGDAPEAVASGAADPQSSAMSGESVGDAGNRSDPDDDRESRPRPTGPTEPVQDAAAAYRCWDGRNTASSADCTTQPDGIRGLRWVFPGADSCTRMPANGRVVYAECTITASSGGSVEVHYSQWESTAAGRRHYFDGKVRKTSRWRGLLRWDLVAQSGSHRFKSALMYPRAPWSVTVYGSSDADRDEVLARVQWRAPRNLRGTSLR
ncbi:hypothetical protein HNR19_003680 [Nocardioides thalensis]|uniref:Uncharacterized protein n=1 Tax=Nocardioides thalensis TaxID=1914755 RepID=A0A853C8K0_9ACTN|nr:hypothetical protein [Nocardioides thalensis]NYJ02982.1 hypothetical protein [Nocardioides thalensis]